MLVIKDSMVVIHLAKLFLLNDSCDYFKGVIIPERVYNEILKGKKKGFPDVPIVLNLIKEKKIGVKKVKNKELVAKAYQFNIQRGEAEVLALYWQENADLIATDDDNVRKKRIILNIEVIGTPAIILQLYKEKIISKEKIHRSISELRHIGWFSNAVLDKILLEAMNYD